MFELWPHPTLFAHTWKETPLQWIDSHPLMGPLMYWQAPGDISHRQKSDLCYTDKKLNVCSPSRLLFCTASKKKNLLFGLIKREHNKRKKSEA